MQDVLVRAERVQTDVLQVTQQTGTVLTIGGNGTIPSALGLVRVTASAAQTGAIITAGTQAGQLLVVVHEGAAANTLTFAAAGTSNVAGGATDSIAGLHAHIFAWDAVTALWYMVGPVAN